MSTPTILKEDSKIVDILRRNGVRHGLVFKDLISKYSTDDQTPEVDFDILDNDENYTYDNQYTFHASSTNYEINNGKKVHSKIETKRLIRFNKLEKLLPFTSTPIINRSSLRSFKSNDKENRLFELSPLKECNYDTKRQNASVNEDSIEIASGSDDVNSDEVNTSETTVISDTNSNNNNNNNNNLATVETVNKLNPVVVLTPLDEKLLPSNKTTPKPIVEQHQEIVKPQTLIVRDKKTEDDRLRRLFFKNIVHIENKVDNTPKLNTNQNDAYIEKLKNSTNKLQIRIAEIRSCTNSNELFENYEIYKSEKQKICMKTSNETTTKTTTSNTTVKILMQPLTTTTTTIQTPSLNDPLKKFLQIKSNKNINTISTTRNDDANLAIKKPKLAICSNNDYLKNFLVKK